MLKVLDQWMDAVNSTDRARMQLARLDIRAGNRNYDHMHSVDHVDSRIALLTRMLLEGDISRERYDAHMDGLMKRKGELTG